MDDYDGKSVIDADGNRVGTVERTYADEHGVVRLVAVKMGGLFGKHRLIPAEGSHLNDQGLNVPYRKDGIEGSPDPGPTVDTLEGNTLERVRTYYGGLSAADQGLAGSSDTITAPVAGTDAREQAGEVSDSEDYIEIPIVEERLVRQVVVKEILRIRKSQLGEIETLPGDLRSEGLEQVPAHSDAPIRDGT